jgi:quaternary ammonium compound-resistance protein SugE
MTMAWTYLLLAGACEIAATTLFRYTGGFTKLWPSLASITVGALSFYLLNRSLSGVPLGTAYAVWTGIGAAGTALIGIAFYAEPTSAMRTLCLVILIAGIFGLKLFGEA